jgi:hypothetical protein
LEADGLTRAVEKSNENDENESEEKELAEVGTHPRGE